MRRIGLFNLVSILLLYALPLQSQSSLKRTISLSAQTGTIEDVLFQIEDQYQIYFTYSRSAIPVENRVRLVEASIPLYYLLDQLFEGTAVAYREKQGRILLKIDPDKEKLLALIALQEDRKRKEALKQKEAKKRREVLISRRKKEQEQLKINPIDPKQAPTIKSSSKNNKLEIDWSQFEFEMEAPTPPDTIVSTSLPPLPKMKESRLAQISVIPFVGTNKDDSDEIKNNLSVNVFWGVNGGLDGLEVGGLFNHLTDKGIGLQIAGLGNSVKNRFIGTQVAGLYNVTGGAFDGIQAAGLFNVARNVNALQAAGFFNIAGQRYSGLQVGGIFNVAKADGPTVQFAGIMNACKGTTQFQLSGLFNFAGDVDGGQVTSLINTARRVDGFQIGLINVADTVSGLPIGILNFIKNGYNRVEFSANETFFGNFSLRIGVKRFYNILYIGGRFDREDIITAGQSAEEVSYSWGLGYGIGSAITLGSRALVNLEALAIHVNEKESWTNTLNLWNQFRLALDIRTGRRTSIFFGPTFNLMLSKRVDDEMNIIGSNIMPYTIYDETTGDRNMKMWVGVNAGIRI